MLLTQPEFQTLCSRILFMEEGAIGIDFETTGFHPHKGARAFLIGIAIGEDKFSYFYKHHALDKNLMEYLTGNPRLKYCAHNAKFEMRFLLTQFGLRFVGDVWDTMVFARVEKNNHLKYNLDSCADRIGLGKYEPFMAWKKANKKKGFDECPEDIIVPYVEHDAWLSLKLYEHQNEVFKTWQKATPIPIAPIIKLEMKTTKNLFEIEEAGIKLDMDYCHRALAYEQERVTRAKERFKELTGEFFVDSRLTFQPIFERFGIPYGKTDKGNPSFSSENLTSDHEIVKCIKDYRDGNKRLSSYWENLIDDQSNGWLHPDIRQTGADTFRMSITEPAAQTWPDDSEDTDCAFPIRRAIIPHNSDCVIASLDYSQMELRLICDEAQDQGMIRDIVNGIDFHQVTADQAGVKRSIAKNGRFAKLYGAGPKKIATTLGVSLEVAQRVSDVIDRTSPRVKSYTRDLIRFAQSSGVGYNAYGRRYFFDQGFEYKYPNYRIQGGCGEILRIAIDEVRDFLEAHARPVSKIILPVHDELVLNLHREDLPLLPKIKEIMINAHRTKKTLAMDVNIAVGPNYHDLEEWNG